MLNKEKLILYIWLFSLIAIIAIGVLLSLQRPSAEIIAADKELVETTEKIRTYYRNRPDYWGLDNGVVIEQHLYAGELKEGKVINSLQKEVIVGSDDKGTKVMPGSRNFIVMYRGLTKEECIAIASFRGKEQDQLGLISMSIQNNKGTHEFSWGNKGLPLSSGQVKKYCQEENNVMWSFE